MISTSTLELGIDIGNICIVVQIGPPVMLVHSFKELAEVAGKKCFESNLIQKSIIFYEADTEMFITSI